MARFERNELGGMLAGIALLAGAACDDGGVAGGHHDDCRPGETVACACPDGGTGTRACESSTCECPGAVLSCSPAAVQLPDVPFGASAAAEVVCTNAGVGEARIPAPDVAVDGPFTASWREPWPSVGLAFGEVVTLDVGFEGLTVGAAAGTLAIESSAGEVETPGRPPRVRGARRGRLHRVPAAR